MAEADARAQLAPRGRTSAVMCSLHAAGEHQHDRHAFADLQGMGQAMQHDVLGPWG